MTTIEYKIEAVTRAGVHAYVGAMGLEPVLTRMGADGFHLDHVLDDDEGSRVLMIFSRETPATTK